MNNNYELIEKRYVKDVEGDVYYLRHIQSGARILKIANKDSNKTFCIAFKTQPDDDSGIPHILEHSVLNGSRKYPVKSPFDQLIKGSLNTFLNAMTGNDVTLYPVASISEKDYFNLADVYLDAVFNPLIYTDKRILKQEGWRVVAMDPADDFKYTGVVYNEMKGAFSDPMRELDTIICRQLFPDNCYGFCSGGYPSAIPTLTQEHFTAFHSKYYHPENSYIFLYGDADLDKELAMLNDGYLSKYTKQGTDYNIPLQAPFAKSKEVSSYYPANDTASSDTDSYLSLNIVATKCTDFNTLKALDFIGELLVNNESGPIRLAFQEQKIGGEIYCYTDPYQQSVFNFSGINCDSAKTHQFRDIIYQELQRAATNGLDKAEVEALLNRREFLLRESNDAQQGIRRIMEILTGWIFGADPISQLESVKNFEEFKLAVADGLLERTIKNCLLNNQHSVLITLMPKQGMEQEIEANTQKELNEYKASLSADEINKLVEENRELDIFQNTPDSPEALKCIPTLSREDLNPKAEDYPVDIRKIGDTKVIAYEGFTNGIVYTRLIFDMKVLPFQMLPYGSLITELMGYLSTSNYGFGELDTYLKNYTGGLSTSNDIYNRIENGKRIPFAEIKLSGKSLIQNLGKMMEIATEIINNTVFNDRQRLRDLIQRLASEADSEINQRAFMYTRNRLDSYFNPASYIDEYLSGINYLQFLKDLNDNFDQKADEIIANLEKVRELVFVRKNLTCYVYCQQEHYQTYADLASKVISQLPDREPEYLDWNVKPEPRNEALVKTSKIQYVLKGYDCLTEDFECSGHASVLNKILSSDYLQNNVRVRGGAYGSWGNLSSEGTVMLMSYRDPNLTATLDIYNKTWEYLENFDDDEDSMLKYIIGTISQKDSPLPTSQKGSVALQRYRTGRSFQKIQSERNQILSTTAADIRNYAKLMREFAEKGAICVFGGEDIINENKNLFNNIIRL